MPATQQARAGVSPARACALRVVRRVFEQGAYADRAFAAEAAGLEPRDRALAMALGYGTVQRRATLDHVAAQLLDRPLERLDAAGAGGAAARVCSSSCSSTGSPTTPRSTRASSWPSGASPRRPAWSTRCCAGRPARDRACSPGSTTTRPRRPRSLHSVPEWLAAQWWEELGADGGARACSARSTSRPSRRSASTRSSPTPDEVAGGAAGAQPARRRACPRASCSTGRSTPRAPSCGGRARSCRSRAPRCSSRASSIPQPGRARARPVRRPGRQDHPPGRADREPGRGRRGRAPSGPGGGARADRRADARRRACGSTSATPRTPRTDGPFDRVLVDPPCSGLGTLQSRPDLRWRPGPEAIGELAALQARILAAGARGRWRPAGRSSTRCARSPAPRAQDVVDAFLREHPEFSVEEPAAWAPEALRGVTAGPASSCCPTATAPTGSSSPGCRR